jgi:iron complex outermembrane receptor protein
MLSRLFLIFTGIVFLSVAAFAQSQPDTVTRPVDSLKPSKSSTIGLKEVHIHGKLSPVSRTSVSSSLSSQQLESSKGSTIGEILKAVAGVNVLKTGSTISKPVIHGLHSNRLMILNNGIKLESQQWGAEHAPEIDPLLAESMHVIKGAESVRYGAEAIGGVIIVEPPKLPVEKGLGGDFNLIGSSNGRAAVSSGMLTGAIASLPGLAWRVQGSLKNAGNVKSADYYLGNTGVRELNYSAALGYRKKNAFYEAYYSQFSTTLGILYSAHVGTMEDIQARIAIGRPLEDAGFANEISVPKQDIVHQLFKLKAHYDFNEHQSLNIKYGFQRNHRQEFDFRRGNREALPITDLVLQTHHLDLDLEQELGDGTKRIYGFNGALQVNENIPGTLANTFIPNYDSIAGGIFAIQKWEREKLSLEAGIRYDFKVFDAAGFRYIQDADLGRDDQANGQYYGGRNDFHNVTGSFGGALKLNHSWRLTSNIGIAWRAPTANELYSNGLHHGAGLYEIGNEELKSEQGYKWITSLKHFTENISIELDAYAQYLNNYIYSEADLSFKQTISGTYPIFRYKQANASFVGADFTMTYKFLPLLSYRINASMVRAENLSTDTYLPNIPSDRIDHSVKLGLKFPSLKDSFLQLGHGFVARQTRYEVGSDYAAPPPAYHLFNLTAGTKYVMNEKQLLFSLGVENLFNKSYKDYMNRYRYYTHDMGRNITLRLAYKF